MNLGFVKTVWPEHPCMILSAHVTSEIAKHQCTNHTEPAQHSYCILREQSKQAGTVPGSALGSKCVQFQVSLQLHHLVLQLVHWVTAILGCFQQAPGSLQGIPGGPLPPADGC